MRRVGCGVQNLGRGPGDPLNAPASKNVPSYVKAADVVVAGRSRSASFVLFSFSLRLRLGAYVLLVPPQDQQSRRTAAGGGSLVLDRVQGLPQIARVHRVDDGVPKAFLRHQPRASQRVARVEAAARRSSMVPYRESGTARPTVLDASRRRRSSFRPSRRFSQSRFQSRSTRARWTRRLACRDVPKARLGTTRCLRPSRLASRGAFALFFSNSRREPRTPRTPRTRGHRTADHVPARARFLRERRVVRREPHVRH